MFCLHPKRDADNRIVYHIGSIWLVILSREKKKYSCVFDWFECLLHLKKQSKQIILEEVIILRHLSFDWMLTIEFDWLLAGESSKSFFSLSRNVQLMSKASLQFVLFPWGSHWLSLSMNSIMDATHVWFDDSSNNYRFRVQ